MKNNLYTQAVKNVTAPKKLIDDTLISIYSTTTESEVITLKNKSHRTLKLTSALAAALVLVFIISAIAFTNANNNTNPNDNDKNSIINHPFILTASAANEASADEITPETYVQIGKIQNLGSGVYLNHNDFNEYNLCIMKEFTLELNCTGENIESVTYSANNTYLTYRPNCEGLLEAVELTDEEREKYDANTSFDGFGWASSCTFDYNCQPQSTLTEIPDYDDWVDGTIPLRIAFHLNLDDGEYDMQALDDYDFTSVFEKEFNAHADEFSLDITANFTDGTKSTKTLKFRCENAGEHIDMYAIEV